MSFKLIVRGHFNPRLLNPGLFNPRFFNHFQISSSDLDSSVKDMRNTSVISDENISLAYEIR